MTSCLSPTAASCLTASAIQGLSEASHELKRGAAEQNKVLAALLENIGKVATLAEQGTSPPAPEAVAPATVAPAVEKPAKKDSTTPGCARKRAWEIIPRPLPDLRRVHRHDNRFTGIVVIEERYRDTAPRDHLR